MPTQTIECTLEGAKRSFCDFYKLPFGTKVSVQYKNRDIRALRGNKVVRRRSWKKVPMDASVSDLRERFMESVDLDYKGMQVVIDVPSVGSNGKTKLKNLIGPLRSDDELYQVYVLMQSVTGAISDLQCEADDPEHAVVSVLQALENAFGTSFVEDCWLNREAFRPTPKIIKRYDRNE